MVDFTAHAALEKLLSFDDVQKILDVGSGAGDHADIMRRRGRTVLTNSLEPPADLICYFQEIDESEKYDGIWAAHVLEHQPDPNSFLRKCFRMLRDDGVLAVTVPPMKHSLVGGHMTLWNGGVLLYQAILAGFDCRNAMLKKYGYNISLIVRKKQAVLPTLRMDNGDIDALSEFFPFRATQGCNGDIEQVNWS